jgi:hypothetical protein
MEPFVEIHSYVLFGISYRPRRVMTVRRNLGSSVAPHEYILYTEYASLISQTRGSHEATLQLSLQYNLVCHNCNDRVNSKNLKFPEAVVLECFVRHCKDRMIATAVYSQSIVYCSRDHC